MRVCTGVGALYVRRRPRVRLEPLQNGGGQERGLRSGTVPTPLAVGLGAACSIAQQEMEVKINPHKNLLKGQQHYQTFWTLAFVLTVRPPEGVHASRPSGQEDHVCNTWCCDERRSQPALPWYTRDKHIDNSSAGR